VPASWLYCICCERSTAVTGYLSSYRRGWRSLLLYLLFFFTASCPCVVGLLRSYLSSFRPQTRLAYVASKASVLFSAFCSCRRLGERLAPATGSSYYCSRVHTYCIPGNVRIRCIRWFFVLYSTVFGYYAMRVR